MRHPDRVLAGLIAGAAATVVIVAEAPPVVRIPAGVVLLIGPGYGWSLVALPPGRIGGAERLVSTLALAFSITILVSLGLHLSPWHLAARPWATTLGVVGVAAMMVLSVRRARVTAEPPIATANRRPSTAAWRSRDAAVGVGVAVVLVLAVVLAKEPLPPPAGVNGYTQLWLVPNSGGAELGVESFELESTAYRLELLSGDTLIRTWELRLPPKGRWTAQTVGAEGPVEARLFLDGDAAVYRRVGGPGTESGSR